MVLMLNYRQGEKKDGLFWCNPQDLGTMVTLKPICNVTSRIQLLAASRWGVKGLWLGQRPRVAMWQRNHLWGDLVTGFWKSWGNWLPAFPLFPPLQAQLEVWAGNRCYKNSLFFFFQMLKQAQVLSSIFFGCFNSSKVLRQGSPHC